MNLKPYIRKANYYETDQMGIIHHSNYIRWFEEARVDYMEQLGFGYDKSLGSGIDFVVLDVQCAYKSMVCFGETVHIIVSISKLSKVRMTISYRVLDAVSGELRSTGTTSHCYYDRNKRSPVSLKNALPDLYDLFDTLVEAPNGNELR